MSGVLASESKAKAEAQKVSEANQKSSEIAAANTGKANSARAAARETGEYSYAKYEEWAAAKGNWQTSEEDYQKWVQARKASDSTKRSSEKASMSGVLASELKAKADEVSEQKRTAETNKINNEEIDINLLAKMIKKLNSLLNLMVSMFSAIFPQSNTESNNYMSVLKPDISEIEDIEEDLM